MGITGLIPFLEKCSSKIFLSDLRGSTVAVDAYCWLHKGVFSCAELLMRGVETDLYVNYCLKYVNMLLSYDIRPILVFDGRHLPAKALTEERRRESRLLSKKRAAELLRLGRVDEAKSHIRRSVDVTHEMALKLIRECRAKNVDCIVAPYEADAQMAWLSQVDIVEYVITEDSDLTIFGARKIIFKLDLTGVGLLVESEKFHLAMGCTKEKYSFKKFQRMCILSGCDYLDSLPGIGLVKACKFILKTDLEADFSKSLKRIPQYLNMRNLEVNDDYIENFLKAEATFMHMFIYNPLNRRIERLHDLSNYKTDVHYCCNAGSLMDSDQALQLALGNLNPFTLQPLDNWNPEESFELRKKASKCIKHRSIWDNVSKSNYNDNFPICSNKIHFGNESRNDKSGENLTKQSKSLKETELFSKKKCDSIHDHSSLQNSEKGKSNETYSYFLPKAKKSTHNPFEKLSNHLAEQESINAFNKSSLLSPKKSNVFSNMNFESSNSFNEIDDCKFSTKSKITHCDIRSRLFVSNVKVANKRQESRSSPELTAAIEKVEHQAKSIQKIQSQLYSSSPIKEVIACNIETAKLTHGFSNTESIPSPVENEFVEDEVFKPLRDLQQNEKPPKLGSNENTSKNFLHFNQRDLSSKDQIKDGNIKKTQRLGLTKFKEIRKNKLDKVTATKSLDSCQTRLSMFGFKKRPALNK